MFACYFEDRLFLIGIKEYHLGCIYFLERSYEADIEASESSSDDHITYEVNTFTNFLL
jgi:hypothetical protein